MDYELINRNKNINRGYRKLEVWQEAIDLFVLVKKKDDEINSVSYKVKAQIEDSALSISSNIAEGYSRRSLKENIQFINISLASMSENYTQIFALFSAGLISKIWFDEYDNKHFSLENKLIKFNKSMISKLDKSDWNNDYMLRETIERYNTDENKSKISFHASMHFTYAFMHFSHASMLFIYTNISLFNRYNSFININLNFWSPYESSFARSKASVFIIKKRN